MTTPRSPAPPTSGGLFYRGLIEASPDGISVLDRDGALLQVNQRGAEQVGCDDPAALIGRSAFEFFGPEEAERARREFGDTFTTGAGRRREFTMRRADSSEFPADIAINLVRDDAGEVVAAITITRDISDTKEVTRALAESEGRFRAIFEAAIDGILVTDVGGWRFRDCNQAMARMLGYSVAELCQLGLDDIHPAAWLERIAELFRRQARGELSLASELPVLRKDGSTMWVDVNSTPVALGGEDCLVGVFRDVSERRRLQERAGGAHRLEAIGRLAGGVAHDFNNLLAIISCYSAFVRDEVESPAARADLDVIRDAVARAERLTNQLLAFSRRQAQKLELVDLNTVVGEVGKMLERVIGEDIGLVIELGDGLRPIMADRGQIEQILLNLAVNARDAMADGGELSVATASRDIEVGDADFPDAAPGRYLLLRVADTGEGMSAAVRARLFEPFFTTRELGQGTGLGLAMVYGVVKQTGGHIAVTSAPGQGATFEVIIPQERSVEAVQPDGPAEGRVATGHTILLVEDEVQVREAARRILVGAGYEVICACDGREALAACRDLLGSIDLMVTDVIMPKMSGKELADRLTYLRPDMRVLFVSGYPENQLSSHGVTSSELAFLSKPFSPESLLAKVRELL